MAYTPSTASLLASLRAAQGRTLYQARHLSLVPPLTAERVSRINAIDESIARANVVTTIDNHGRSRLC